MGKVLQFRAPRKRGSTKRSGNTLLQFPIQNTCPTCGRIIGDPEEDLCECLTCGKQYCNNKHCDWTCACDRFAIEIAERAALMSERNAVSHYTNGIPTA